MTRTAIDPDTGLTVEVSDNTPLNNKGTKHYLLTAKEQADFDAAKVRYDADAGKRATKVIIRKRRAEYGTPEVQLEYIAENGIEAFQNKVNDIKLRNPL